MSLLVKLYWIAVFGSVWGAIELFGGDFMRLQNLPYKAAILSALAMGILLIGKRVVPQIGSAVAIGAVACIYKLTSNGFYSCQLLAVMIHAVSFDLVYSLIRNQIDQSVLARSLAAVAITAISFTGFGFVNTYVIPEPHWADRGLPGIIDYLRANGLIGALLSVVTMLSAARLARRLDGVSIKEVAGWRPLSPGFSASVLVLCWAAGVIFALS